MSRTSREPPTYKCAYFSAHHCCNSSTDRCPKSVSLCWPNGIAVQLAHTGTNNNAFVCANIVALPPPDPCSYGRAHK